MVENQHRKIKGYRELTEEEIILMNEGKILADQVGAYLDKINVTNETDRRWLSIGRTNLQQGFMAVVRAIAKPTTF